MENGEEDRLLTFSMEFYNKIDKMIAVLPDTEYMEMALYSLQMILAKGCAISVDPEKAFLNMCGEIQENMHSFRKLIMEESC